MALIELTSPASSAVDLDELKMYLRVTTPDEDSLVEFYARAASQIFEIKTRRRLVGRSCRLDLPGFPADGIEIPVAPVQADGLSIQYFDSSGTLTTWDPEGFILDQTSHLPRITTAPGSSFPSAQSGRPNAVQISFTAGYGSSPADVPEGIRWGVFYLAAHAFVHRTPVVNGTVAEVPRTLQYVIDAYRIWSA